MRSGKFLLGTGIALITFGILYILYYTSALSVLTRVILAFAALILSGVAIQRTLKLNGVGGLYMLGGRKGLGAIDRISKKGVKFWDAMTMWGLTLGFGLLAYPLVKGRIDKRVFVIGIISSFFTMPVKRRAKSSIISFISCNE